MANIDHIDTPAFRRFRIEPNCDHHYKNQDIRWTRLYPTKTPCHYTAPPRERKGKSRSNRIKPLTGRFLHSPKGQSKSLISHGPNYLVNFCREYSMTDQPEQNQ